MTKKFIETNDVLNAIKAYFKKAINDNAKVDAFDCAVDLCKAIQLIALSEDEERKPFNRSFAEYAAETKRIEKTIFD